VNDEALYEGKRAAELEFLAPNCDTAYYVVLVFLKLINNDCSRRTRIIRESYQQFVQNFSGFQWFLDVSGFPLGLRKPGKGSK
jgi:hypothetical protein